MWRIGTFGARDLTELATLSAKAHSSYSRGSAPWPRTATGAKRSARRRRQSCLLGAGHVGRALVMALARLPFAARWVDPRPEAFPERAPANLKFVAAPDPRSELTAASDGALVVVTTHSHPLDLAVIAAAVAAHLLMACNAS